MKLVTDICYGYTIITCKFYVRFFIFITYFRVTVGINCRALTRCMNISYVVGQGPANGVLYQCIVSIL
jgi:hypothetical protein